MNRQQIRDRYIAEMAITFENDPTHSHKDYIRIRTKKLLKDIQRENGLHPINSIPRWVQWTCLFMMFMGFIGITCTLIHFESLI